MQRALVIGGSGALGRSLVEAFKAASWETLSVDLTANPTADKSIAWGPDAPAWGLQLSSLRQTFAGSQPFAAILVAAGGWAGGGAVDGDALVASTEAMLRVCLHPALLGGAVAAHHLAPGGLLVLTGSAAALGPTPGMLAYGCIKAATHHLAASLAVPSAGLPPGARVLTLAPSVIDTPSNRQYMSGPGVDTGSWTPPAHIAAQCVEWAAGRAAPPPSGSVVEPITAGGATTWRVQQLY